EWPPYRHQLIYYWRCLSARRAFESRYVRVCSMCCVTLISLINCCFEIDKRNSRVVVSGGAGERRKRK
ncbi:hypothetical protein, partial [Oleiphilus sp. HI0086]|uniref:hypothetical protein n=1 Tax=Oleiphilus sp. HI0086 TaxID=1822260 RepID=UPI001E3AA5D4